LATGVLSSAARASASRRNNIEHCSEDDQTPLLDDHKRVALWLTYLVDCKHYCRTWKQIGTLLCRRSRPFGPGQLSGLFARRQARRVRVGRHDSLDRLVECTDHPVAHNPAIFVGSRERCQISTAKKNIPQLLGQILETVKLCCKLRSYVLKPNHVTPFRVNLTPQLWVANDGSH
jgi:hypothetical protein